MAKIDDLTSKLQLNPVVAGVSVSAILVFLVFGAVFTDTATVVFGATQTFISEQLGWFSVTAMTVFLVFAVFLACSKYGRLRLGKPEDRPTYGLTSWFAMLFTAGMGIGILFYGVAEPMWHYIDPPMAEPASAAATQESLQFTFYHWGFHAWAVYVVVGLSLAYFAYRHDKPLLVRSAFYPLLGDRVEGRAGDAIDILAIFGTLFGVATSLGLGVLQISAGLAHVTGLEASLPVQLGLIAIITVAAAISVWAGLDGGIKRLATVCLYLGGFLLAFVLLVGPTGYLLQSYVQGVGSYLGAIPSLTFYTDAYSNNEGWQSAWTMFYWGWWISWSPFVGMFIARISRGRTIRQFIAGVLLVPTAVTCFWMTVFGGTGLYQETVQGLGLADLVEQNEDAALFQMLDNLAPTLGTIAGVLAVVLIILFFVTSSDSGSLVIDILASGGNPEPPRIQRVSWSVAEGLVAAVLLGAGGLEALQAASITTGLPFTVVILAMCVGLHRQLRTDYAALTAEDGDTIPRRTAHKAAASARQGVAASTRRKGQPPGEVEEQDRADSVGGQS